VKVNRRTAFASQMMAAAYRLFRGALASHCPVYPLCQFLRLDRGGGRAGIEASARRRPQTCYKDATGGAGKNAA
jgi:hypothetical protein